MRHYKGGFALMVLLSFGELRFWLDKEYAHAVAQNMDSASQMWSDVAMFCVENRIRYTIASEDCTCYRQEDMNNGNHGYLRCSKGMKFNLKACVCDRSQNVVCPPIWPWITPRECAVAGAKADVSGLVKAITELTAFFERHLAKKNGNTVFSPLSISVVLAMLYEGSRGNTRAQMEKAAHFGTVSDLKSAFKSLLLDVNAAKENATLLSANRIYPSTTYPFLDSYLQVIRDYYLSETVQLDYISNPELARQTINQWVEEQTQDLIKDLIPPNGIDPSTVMVLVNALYFKGFWEKPFDPKLTTKRKFCQAPRSCVDVDMMYQQGKFRFDMTREFQELYLPYVGGDVVMVITLPHDRLAFEKLREVFGSSREPVRALPRKRDVRVFLPRFKVEEKYDLVPVLKAMGLTDLFQPRVCDLSGMDGTRDLYVSLFVHKAVVNVNEEGTEAAAATGSGISYTSLPPLFNANRPFFFRIEHVASGNILFAGTVVKP